MIYSYALTTLQRVKDRIFDPNNTTTITGDTVNGSVTISNVVVPSCLLAGQTITGIGIAAGTIIVSVGTTSITLNQPAIADGTAVTFTVPNQPVNFDTILTRMINGVTDFLQRECGGRQFAQKLNINEVYSAYGAKQKYVITKQCPINVFISSGNTISGSAIITGITATAGMQAGMPIQGDNIPANTTIVSVDSASQLTLSAAASTTLTGAYFQVSGLVTFAWRAGTPSNPSWTPFITDQFEVVEDGKAGIIRIYGVFPRLYNNMIRVTYWSGFLIDWINAGNGTTHTLPADLSDTAENLVVRVFKRRILAGKTAEALEGATTSWDREIDQTDKDVIGHYRQMPSIF